MSTNAKFITKLSLILFTISAVCVLLLALCNNLTKDTIAKINLEKQQKAQKEVISASSFKKIDYDGVEEVYIAKNGDETIGYCVKVAPKGFGGDIEMMVGIDTFLDVTGVSIINMSETPGLGSKANSEGFLSQYSGLAKDIEVIKSGAPNGNQIVAISGATVTSNAVTQGVNDAIYIIEKITGVEK